MRKISWKSNQIKTKNSTINRFLKDDVNEYLEEEEVLKFDPDLFLEKVRLLINQNQINIIYEIEEMIQLFDISELFSVLNSQLAKYVFDRITNISQAMPRKFIMTCLNLCVFFTTVYTQKDKRFSFVQQHYLLNFPLFRCNFHYIVQRTR